MANLTGQQFAKEFKSSWAKSLLVYHPEYKKLKYAEDSLRPTFNFIDSIQVAVTTAFAPINSDPFFSTISTGSDKTLMRKFSDTAWLGNYSMWQLAYAEAFGCKTNLNNTTRDNCYANMPKKLATVGTVVNTGAGNVTLTTALQSAAWSFYKAAYSRAREEMVYRFINVRPGTVDTLNNRGLINFNYRIYFPYNNVQSAENNDWTSWYPNNAGVLPPVNLTDSVNADRNKCDAYVPSWRAALLSCPTLDTMNAVKKEAILNSIINKMLIVCGNGTDANNPNGSSTVAPQYQGTTYTSFEQVIVNVFDSAGIDSDLYCNPYVIEYPKPYCKHPHPPATRIRVGNICEVLN